MAIKDLFVPKWQHSKAAIRLASIDEIAGNIALLVELAKTDPSPEVRIAAIKKIDDESVLSAIIAGERDDAVKKAAVEKHELVFKKILATVTDPAVVVPLLEKHGGEKAITSYLCDQIRDVEIQRILIGKVKTPQLLCKIAEHACAVETAEYIIKTIDDKELLQRLAAKASNKKIRLLALKKGETLGADPLAEQQSITKTLEQCVGSINIHVGLENLEQSEEVLEMARSVWNRYDAGRTHPAAARFIAAEAELAGKITACKESHARLLLLTSLVGQYESAVQEPFDVAAQKCADLDAQWEGIDKTGLSGTAGYEAIERQLLAANKILEKMRLSAEAAKAAVRKNAEAVNACCDELERIVRSDAPVDSKRYESILARWRVVSALDHGVPSAVERFAQLQREYHEKTATLEAEKKKAVESEAELLERMVLRMEWASQAPVEQAGKLSREITDLKRAWDRPFVLARHHKETLEERFKGAHERFMVNLFEFKDQNAWKEWATGNAALKICTDIEEFEQKLKQGEPLNNLMRKVNVFQQDWKQAVGRDRSAAPTLNERFTAACNRIFELGCAGKKTLLTQLQQIVESDTGRDTVETVKQIQQQWNEIGYLPMSIEKEVSESFHTACNAFFEQRREAYQNYAAELQKNTLVREEICKEGETLAGSSSWKETIASFSALQKKWEESWPAPMKRSRELWDLFNGYRETFFERYEAYKQGNVSVRESLCEKAEALLALISQEPAIETPLEAAPTDGENSATVNADTPEKAPGINYSRLFSEVIALQREWKECGPVTKEHNETLWQRFRPACEKVIARIKEEHECNRVLKEALAVEAESLSGSQEWEQTALQFGVIREKWKLIPPAARHDDQALWMRLQAAANAFFDSRRNHFAQKKASTQKQLEIRSELCAEMELLVRVAGKGRLLRNEKPMSAAEALKMGMSMRNEVDVDGDSAKTADNIKKRAFRIMDKWDAELPGSGRDFVQLERRFYDAVDILRSK